MNSECLKKYKVETPIEVEHEIEHKSDEVSRRRSLGVGLRKIPRVNYRCWFWKLYIVKY